MEYPKPGQWVVSYGHEAGVVLDVKDDIVLMHVAAPDGTTLKQLRINKKFIEKATLKQIPESRRPRPEPVLVQEVPATAPAEEITTWHWYSLIKAKLSALKQSSIKLLHKI